MGFIRKFGKVIGIFLLFIIAFFLCIYFIIIPFTTIKSQIIQLLLALAAIIFIIYKRLGDYHKEKIRQLFARLLPYPNRVITYVKEWLQRFRTSSRQEQLRIIKKPGLIFIVLFLLWQIGPLFLPPRVSFSFPGNASTENPLDSKIEIIFDRGMNKSLVEKNFRLSPAVEGTFDWESNQKLIFTPKTQLIRGQKYTAELGGLTLSSFFSPLWGSHTISFTTVGDPKVAVYSPQNEAVEGFSPVIVVFDRPMIPLTATTKSVLKKPAFTISPSVVGEGRWLGTTAYQFTPSVPFKKATTYTVVVDSGLKSQDGGSLNSNISWQFSSPRPHVEAVTPRSGYSFASPVASVSATFNQPVDPASAAKYFKLLDSTNTSVPGKVVVSGKTLGFYASTPLNREKNYRAVVSSGLQSTDGPNGLESDYSWNFTVADLPKVLKSSPENEGKDIQARNSIEVIFKTPMDQESFIGNVFISPEPDAKPELVFNNYQGVNTLTIGTYLQRSTNYTITIGPDVKDQYGVPLGKAYTFNFNTAPYQPNVSIMPFGVFFATFNQQITPRIVAQVTNTSRIDYNLYKLSRNDLLDLYRKRYENVCGSDYHQCRNWQNYNPAALQKVRSWNETFDINPNVPITVVTKVTDQNGGNLQSGFYFLEAKLSTGQHDNLVMIVSNATLTVKKSSQQIFSWAVDQSSGTVLSGMNMELTDSYGNSLAKGQSNQDGVWQQDVNLNQKDNLLLFAQKDNDLVVASSNWRQGINRYDFGLPSYYNPSEQKDYQDSTNRYKLFLTLDRPIYRPGQKVYFKGLIKKDNDAAYANLAPGEKVSVTINDARNRPLYTQSLPINSYGSFADSFVLSADATLGDYQLQATYSNNGITQQFQVEEYRRPDMLLTIKTNKSYYLPNEVPQISINSSYYFGAPVTNAPVQWSVQTQDYFFKWDKDWRYEFGDPEGYWARWSGYGQNNGSETLVGSGKGVTDNDGNLNLQLPFNMGKYKTSQRLIVAASVSDQSNQAVGSSGEYIIHQGGIYVGLHPESYGSKSGQESKVGVVTVLPNGNEAPNTPVSIEFYKRTWDTVRQQDPSSGQYIYVSNPHDTLVSSTSVTTDNLGYSAASFTPSEGGTYRVLAKATDSSGNTNRTSSYLWVSGYGFVTDRNNNDRILVVPDKRQYAVGDTASIFVNSPFASGSAKTLLTVERAKVIGYQIVDTNDQTNNFPLTINPGYSPNVYIGAVLVKGGNLVKAPPEMKIGYVEVKVTDKKQQVAVDIQTDKKRYKPGDTMHATITTKDLLGHPVSSELAVGLVDKAVWDLSRIQLPDIYQYFYQPRNLEVDTSQLLTISMDRINKNTNLGAKGGSGGCFTADTQILLQGGMTKRIADIQPGDTVLTKSYPASVTLEPGKVTATYKHSVDHYIIINGTIQVTPVHLIYVNNGWKVAGKIKIGDYLLDKNNLPIRVFSLEQVFGKDIAVYNLEVDKYHTYFADGIYVHNQKGGGPDTARQNFPETAYWNPSLITGANGQADITVKLPDNLTTWRLAVIADTSDSAFGSAITEFLVNRDVLIRPVLPRFLSVGDQAQMGAIIVNTSGATADVSVSMSGKGFTVNDNQPRVATIADGDQVKLLWTTMVSSTNSAQVYISVNDKDGSPRDSLLQTLPVKSYSIPEVVATAGQVADTAQENVNLPKDIDPTRGQAEVTISPSLGSGSIEALSYLYEYPYYCTEQTTSKLLPAIYARRVFKQAKIDSLGVVTMAQLKFLINDGLQRLNNTQHSDGGWSWWLEGDSDPVMTAYAYQSLYEAKKDGLIVSDNTFNQAESYLWQSLSRGKTLDRDSQAYILYALKDSRRDITAPFAATLYDHRFELTMQSRAYLALVLHKSGMSGQANRVYGEMISLAKKTATSTHWEDSNKNYFYWFSDAKSATAAGLEMLLAFDPHSPYIPEVVRYLMASRTDNYWGSTQETASVVKAISMQLLSQQNKNLQEKYKLEVNGQNLKSGQFQPSDLLNLEKYIAPVSNLKLGKDNSFRLSKSGTGNLYYNFNLRYFLPFAQIKSLDQGIVVVREFVDSNGHILPSDTIKEGTEAWVRLTIVAPALRQYVTVEDILPAGLESVNESLKNVVSLSKTPPKSQTRNHEQHYQPSYFDHKEYHDDRTTLFARYLPAGVYEVTYRVRATTPGKYHYLPAQAYEMYFPDVSGHSDGGWLTVVPR